MSFLASLFLCLPASLSATTVSGTFKRPDGTPINGTVEFILSQQAKTITPPVTFAPVLTTCPVTNGDISAGCTVQGNDTLDPAGTFYRVRVLDLNNIVVLSQANYTISGAAVNLSELPVTATDTLVPPTGSVTGNMNVTGNLTVGGTATFGADPQNFAHLRLLGATSDPGSVAAGSVFHRSDLNTIRFRAGGIEIFDGSQYLPLFASSSQTLDLNASLRIPGGGSANFKRLNHLRLIDPDLWTETGVTAKINAAITDCLGAECRIVLPTNLLSGVHTRSTWAETSAVLDLRGDELDPFVLGRYFSPFKFVSRKTTDNSGTQDLFPTLRVLQFHDAGGDNTGGGPKDTYFTFAGDLYSAGRGEDISVRGATFKFGEGDAAAVAASTDQYGNCLESGGECAVGLRAQVRQGQAVMTATVDSYTAGSRTIAFSGASQEDKLGVGRYILNLTAAKVYTAGSVASINTAAPPVVTGSATAWATQFGSGAHSDLCFSQNDDDAAFPGGTAKLVVPIRSVASDTSLTLDFDPQQADKSWPGDSNGSSYRIYKCAQIETINFAGGSFIHAAGGTTDWAAADTLEVPLGWAWYGSGANLIVQNYLPSFSILGLKITNSGSDEPLDQGIQIAGKAAVGLQFDNTWQCKANGVNCSQAGFTTGVRFQNPPTVGLHYATPASGNNITVRWNDQSGGSTGNVDWDYGTTSDCLNLTHAASSSNLIQQCPVAGQIIATIYSTRSYHDIGGVTGTVPGSGLLRVRSGNGGTGILVGRNQANSANVTLLTYSTSDRFQLTQSGTPVEFVGGIHPDGGGFKHRRVSTGSCGTSGCQVTVSWTTAFADTNYSVNCSVQDSTAQSETTGLRLAKINSIAAGSVTVDLDNLSGSAITGTVHCTAVHD